MLLGIGAYEALFLLILLLIVVPIGIIAIYGRWKLLTRMGKPGWALFIPGYYLWQLGSGAALDNRALIALAAGLDIVRVFMVAFGTTSTLLWAFVMLAFYVLNLYVMYRVSLAFQHKWGSAVLLWLFGGLYMFYMQDQAHGAYIGPLASEGSGPNAPADVRATTLPTTPEEGVEPSSSTPLAAGESQPSAESLAASESQASMEPLDASESQSSRDSSEQRLDEPQSEQQVILPDVQSDSTLPVPPPRSGEPFAISDAVQPEGVDVPCDQVEVASQEVAAPQAEKLSPIVKGAIILGTVALCLFIVVQFVANLNSGDQQSIQTPYSSTTSSNNSVADSSPAREIGGNAAAHASDSIQWAGDIATGIMQIPSDWKVLRTGVASETEYFYTYEGGNSETLKMSVEIGSYSEEAEKAKGQDGEATELTVAGNNAVRVVTRQNDSLGKTSYYVCYPELWKDGEERFVLIEFTYKEEPAWIEASVAGMTFENYAAGKEKETFPEIGLGDLGVKDTQWAGCEKTGYLRIANDWPVMTAASDAQSSFLMYGGHYVKNPDGSYGLSGYIQIGNDSVDWRDLNDMADEIFEGAKNTAVEHVKVNGIDGHILSCEFEMDETPMNGYLCYLDDSNGFWQGTFVTLLIPQGSTEVSFDDLLSTYTKSKPAA